MDALYRLSYRGTVCDIMCDKLPLLYTRKIQKSTNYFADFPPAPPTFATGLFMLFKILDVYFFLASPS